jgi:trehalose 2-sulfotransferase
MPLRDRLAASGKRFYCVCFSPRSGSTLLRDDLHQCGLGAAHEFFQLTHPSTIDYSISDYVVRTAEQTHGDVVGFKITWYQASVLTQRLLDEGEDAVSFDLRTVFPGLRHIHLVRNDKVAQAVSLWRAQHSDLWHWEVGTNVDRGHPAYDFVAIEGLLRHLVVEDALWESHFSHLRIPCLTVHYEDYIEDRLGTLASIADFLGEHLEPVTLVDRIQKMRDEWSEGIIERVWADLRASGDPDLRILTQGLTGKGRVG